MGDPNNSGTPGGANFDTLRRRLQGVGGQPLPPSAGTGPKDQQPGGDVWRAPQRATPPPQPGSVATSGGPLNPSSTNPPTSAGPVNYNPQRTPDILAPQDTGRRAIGPESRGGATPLNPSPNGPSRMGGDVLKPAVGAPRGGGFTTPSWGGQGSGSAATPNVPRQRPGGNPMPGGGDIGDDYRPAGNGPGGLSV